MIFKRWYNELRRMWNSFFRPPSADMGFLRRERFAMVYGISSVVLFVHTSYLLFKRFEDPEFVEKATLKPPPDAKHIKIEFDASKFTLATKNEENKFHDQEIKSS